MMKIESHHLQKHRNQFVSGRFIIDAKINGQKYEEKQSIYILQKYHRAKYLLMTKGEIKIVLYLSDQYVSDSIGNDTCQHHMPPDLMH